MKSLVLLLALAGLAGCTFAKKHPGITVGLVSGTIAYGTCQMSVDRFGTCAIVGGAVGAVLGGITGLLAILGADKANQIPTEEEEEAERRRLQTTTEPPPGLPPDAGVPLAPPPVPLDAGAAPPLAPVDAGM